MPEPAPSPAENGVPEGVPAALAGDAFPNAEELMRDALAAHRPPPPPPAEPIVTSPQVDAIPVPEPEPVAVEPEPEPEPEPERPSRSPWRQRPAWEPPTPTPAPPAPPPVAPAPSAVVASVARPQAARHLITTLDEPRARAVARRDRRRRRAAAPPAARAGRDAAGRRGVPARRAHPGRHALGPGPRTVVLAGAAGSGAPRLVAGIAGAYATRTTLDVACVSLRTPDGGRALAAALAPLGVPVHTAMDGADAATHVRLLGHDALVLVDTAPVTPDDAGRLASDLRALGPHELHLALGPGGGPSASALMQILRPHRLALGDPSDPLHLGAVLQAAIDAALPASRSWPAPRRPGAPISRSTRRTPPRWPAPSRADRGGQGEEGEEGKAVRPRSPTPSPGSPTTRARGRRSGSPSRGRASSGSWP